VECADRNVAAGNYTLRYNVLSTCDYSGVHETTSAGIVLASLNATDRAAVELAAPRGSIRKSKLCRGSLFTLRFLL
jgi:hypothetical protein